MYIIVGLGNPGSSYEYNRHNAGFLVIDEIARYYNFDDPVNKFDSQLFKGVIGTKKVLLVKPQTFMNLSGKSVSHFVNFYKIDITKLVVIYDDLDVPFGKLKINVGGGTAGHNGLKSINSLVKNEYNKFKVGISHPGEKHQVNNYVLTDFKKDELDQVHKMGKNIAENLPIFFSSGREEFLNKYYLES
jgi:PTH1 family peptidyl-tRNA hydrolase